MKQGMKLMSDPRVHQSLMQDERVMKAVMQMMAVPGHGAELHATSRSSASVKSIALATEDEVKDSESAPCGGSTRSSRG